MGRIFDNAPEPERSYREGLSRAARAAIEFRATSGYSRELADQLCKTGRASYVEADDGAAHMGIVWEDDDKMIELLYTDEALYDVSDEQTGLPPPEEFIHTIYLDRKMATHLLRKLIQFLGPLDAMGAV